MAAPLGGTWVPFRIASEAAKGQKEQTFGGHTPKPVGFLQQEEGRSQAREVQNVALDPTGSAHIGFDECEKRGRYE